MAAQAWSCKSDVVMSQARTYNHPKPWHCCRLWLTRQQLVKCSKVCRDFILHRLSQQQHAKVEMLSV